MIIILSNSYSLLLFLFNYEPTLRLKLKHNITNLSSGWIQSRNLVSCPLMVSCKNWLSGFYLLNQLTEKRACLLLMWVLNKASITNEKKPKDILTTFCCDSYNTDCLKRICQICSTRYVMYKEFNNETVLTIFLYIRFFGTRSDLKLLWEIWVASFVMLVKFAPMVSIWVG